MSGRWAPNEGSGPRWAGPSAGGGGHFRRPHFGPVSAVLIAAVLGALFGLGADRLSARWPAHADGRVRPPDWRTVVVVVASGLAFGALAGRWPLVRDFTVLAVYAAALIVLLATDLDQKLLPDAITLPLIPYSAVVLV